MAGLLGSFFEDDTDLPRGGMFPRGGILGGYGPMAGNQKAALLFAGLRDAVNSFSGAQPSYYAAQQGEDIARQNASSQRQSTIKGIQEAYAKGDMKTVRMLAAQDPEIGASILKVLEQDAPKFQNGPDGLYELPTAAGGLPKLVVPGQKKPPQTRTFRSGNEEITQEEDGQGGWREIGRGAAWKPEAADGDGNKPPTGYYWGPDGISLIAIPGGPADSTGKNSKATDTQRVTALYADRAREAETVLSGQGGVEGQGTSFWQNARSQVPGVGNYLVSDSRQKYDQARRNFVNAVLRKESGAVISKEEFANADLQYFPQPGDTQQVLDQKRANRETAIEGLKRAAGTAMNPQGEPQRQAAPANSGWTVKRR